MRILVTLLIGAMLFPAMCFGAYDSKELCFIPWGENQDQINTPILEFIDNDDTLGGSYVPSGGPQAGFIDASDRIYLWCYEPGYFKAFDNNGNLTLDIGPDSSQNGKVIYLSSVMSAYVDSLYRIYLESFPQMTYISVLDHNGNLVDKLNPFGPDSGVFVSSMKYNSLDVLTFDCWYKGFYTYMNDRFYDGASFGWRAGDGYYYHVAAYDSSTIMFKKYLNPGLDGIAEWRDTTFVYYQGSLKSAGLLGIDDSLNIYIRFVDNDSLRQGIQIYNINYELIDEIIMPLYTNRYMWYMPTFVRRDSTIHEFRCLDDGLHVVKWTRE
jgi:hypothetical protein